MITFWVFEGDFGGQMYLTVRSDLVGPAAQLDELLARLDRVAWPSHEGAGASWYPRIVESAAGLADGLGDCPAFMDAVWLHPEFRNDGDVVRRLLDLNAETQVRFDEP